MKSSESSTTSMIEKKRLEMISPKSVKSDGNGNEFHQNHIRCFYCTKANFMSLDQLTHHINLMHSHKIMKEHRKTRSEHESSSYHQRNNYFLSCEYCLMKFSSSEKLIKHINLIHDDKMRANEELMNSKVLSEQSNDGSGSKKSVNKYGDLDEQPTDLSQRIAAKKIKIEGYGSIAKHFDVPQPSASSGASIRTPGTPDAFLCNQCNASLPSFELFRLHLKNHLEESYGN